MKYPLSESSPNTSEDENRPTAVPPRSLDFRDVPSLAEIAPDMNSRQPNPLRDDGEVRRLPTQNMSRRENRPRDTPSRHTEGVAEPPPSVEPSAEVGPEVVRDRQSILHLVRMRVLSYGQLARLTYFNADKTVARRRLRRLHERGWVELWDRPVAFGGTPRYAYPSRRALAWGHAVMDKAVTGSPLEPLVRLMTPATPRQPWKFQPGVIPLFLGHTEEANDVLIAWMRKSGERVLWASSWDCPFPEHIEWRTMPQPDYVLVLQRDGLPHLLFGEHDRGTETREVVARKFRVYRTWIDTPEIMERTFGFRSFHVVVTVSGERAQRRLQHLVQLAHDEGVDGFTTLMLAGPDVAPHSHR
ncbi:MAG TPA: replication-relaxation family protein [Thermoanaerobaculia bacterium]